MTIGVTLTRATSPASDDRDRLETVLGDGGERLAEVFGRHLGPHLATADRYGEPATR
jgi:hypothetical protein